MSLSVIHVIFVIVYPLKALLGVLVFISNFFVFLIFMTRNKKVPTDYLIMPNLFVDSLQGIATCFPYYLISGKFIFSSAFVEEIFIFFSLVMLMLMTLNRYTAVLRPIKYKKWFSLRNVIIVVLMILLLTLIIFALLLNFLYFHEIVEVENGDQSDENDEKMFSVRDTNGNETRSENLLTSYRIDDIAEISAFHVNHLIFFIWPQLQLALVLINAIMICIVYRAISKQESFFT